MALLPCAGEAGGQVGHNVIHAGDDVQQVRHDAHTDAAGVPRLGKGGLNAHNQQIDICQHPEDALHEHKPRVIGRPCRLEGHGNGLNDGKGRLQLLEEAAQPLKAVAVGEDLIEGIADDLNDALDGLQCRLGLFHHGLAVGLPCGFDGAHDILNFFLNV